MWSRVTLKEKAKTLIHRSYWQYVLAALVLAIAAAGVGGIYSYSNGLLTLNVGVGGGGFHEQGYYAAHGPFAGWMPFFLGLFGIAAVISIVLRLALRFFVCAPLEVGAQRFFVINRVMTGKTSLSEIVHPFSNSYRNVVKVQFFRWLYLFLWSLLFVIPGIVKSSEYRMVPYSLAESPDMDQREVFRLSEEMMYGNKLDAFVLDLSFVGWEALNCLTFGFLGIFYVKPYEAATNAELYATLRDSYLGKKQTGAAGETEA